MGIKEAMAHLRVQTAYRDGCKVLVLAGDDALRAVAGACELDLVPAGAVELSALQRGLQALAKFWSAQGVKAKRR
jgi:hypothetical protein